MRIATVSEDHIEYAETVYKDLENSGIRVEKDFRNEKLGYKVREAQLMKVPYLLVIGDKEVETKTVSPRRLGGKNLDPINIKEFVELSVKENNSEMYTAEVK